MKRVQFAGGGVAAALALAAAPRPAQAAQFNYKYGTPTQPTHPLTLRAIQMWDAVRSETGGRLDVKVFPNSELGGDTAVLTQLRSNAIQFLNFTGGIMASVVPSAAVDGVGYAFKNSEQAFATMDGPLGALVRKDLMAAGIFAFEKIWDNGFRQITSGTKPIQTDADLAGFKIRTPASKLWVEMFKALGASPTPMNIAELYTSLQTHIVDGQENPLAIIEAAKFYEVQKYLSITNHMWTGFWLIANGDAWSALPGDIQTVVTRNATKYALLERSDVAKMTTETLAQLKTQGMAVNTADAASFKAKLGPYYAVAKELVGAQAFGLLEQSVGKLS